MPVDPQLLEQVFDICHENDKINWRLFTDNFNWQERLDFSNLVADRKTIFISFTLNYNNKIDWCLLMIIVILLFIIYHL